MRTNFQLFYRQTGVREPGQLIRPRLIQIGKFEFPFQSIYHFRTSSSSIEGPDYRDPLYADNDGRVYIQHVTELTTKIGNPIRTVHTPEKMILDFRKRSRLFKPLRQDKALTINQKNLLVVNYAMLNPLYRYIVSFKSTYFRWKNYSNTFWGNIQKTHERFGWNQFVEIELPDKLPTYSDFNRLGNTVSDDTLESFRSIEALNLFDLFLWLGDKRKESSLSLLSDEAMAKTTLVFKVGTYFFTINLGVWDGWRRNVKDEAKKQNLYSPSALQLRLVSLLYGIKDLDSGITSVEDDIEAIDSDDETLSEVPFDEGVPSVLKEDKRLPVTRAVDEGTRHELTLIEDKDIANALPDLDDILETGLDTYTSEPKLQTLGEPLRRRATDAAPKKVINRVVGASIIDEADETPVPLDELLTKEIENTAKEYLDIGLMSPKAYAKILEESVKYKSIPNPYDPSKTIGESLEITDDDVSLPELDKRKDSDCIIDKSMLSSGIKAIRNKYLEKCHSKFILNAVMSVQRQGIMIKDYRMEVVRDAMNHFEIHTVTFKPVHGKQSTKIFRIPVIDKDGRYVSNGTKKQLKWQRADVPIRKVNPSRVALTSYKNKIFIDRSPKSVNDYEKWLTKAIIGINEDVNDERVIDLKLSNVFDQSKFLPRIYTLLAKTMVGFKTLYNTELYFDYNNREKHFLEVFNIDVTDVETGSMVCVGTRSNNPVLVDNNNAFYERLKNGELNVIGSISDLIELDSSSEKIEIIEMGVSNKTYPVGFVMAYALGIDKLLEILKCEFEVIPRSDRRSLNPNEYRLVFSDQVIILNKLDQRSSMILAGLNRFHNAMKLYNLNDFNGKDVYYKLIDGSVRGNRYLREIDDTFRAWVDPITREILQRMGEPTTVEGLLIRSAELLLNDWSPEEVDPAFMRYRGYERIAGTIFNELNMSAKRFNARVNTGNEQLELDPHKIWSKIDQDSTVGLVEESNPIKDVRAGEAMSYRGEGGRSSVSMVERTRPYHENDLGTLSESSPDSGDVGVVAYMVPDPNFTNLFGMTRRLNRDKDGVSKLISTSLLLAPASETDDAKRQGFVSIQNAQTIACDGAEVLPFRTGKELTLAAEASGIFATTASQNGKVISKSKNAITVEYEDGTKESIALGKEFGIDSGIVYPHDLVTSLNEGDSFEKGQELVYNSKFFTEDWMNPGRIAYKAGVTAWCAVNESIDCFEDSSAISEQLAEKLKTQIVEVKNVIVRFDQILSDVVNIGDEVDLDSILCIIENPEMADTGLFGEASIDTLRRISATMTPTANMVGRVVKVECFYHGDREEMSESVLHYAMESDKRRKRAAKSSGQPYYTGEVDTSFRLKGEAIDYDHMAIQIYIEHDVLCSNGDKISAGNQMKSVISRVLSGVNETESGIPIDLLFGNTSQEARKVLSMKISGMVNSYLNSLTKHVVGVYRGEVKPRRNLNK